MAKQETWDITSDEYWNLFVMKVGVISAKELIVGDFLTRDSDPYCVITVGPHSQQTKVMKKTLAPTWNETFYFFGVEQQKTMVFNVFDEDPHGKDDELGNLELDVTPFFQPNGNYSGWMPLKNVKHGQLQFTIECRLMVPVRTERRLEIANKELEIIKSENVELLSDLEKERTATTTLQEQLSQQVEVTRGFEETIKKLKTEGPKNSTGLQAENEDLKKQLRALQEDMKNVQDGTIEIRPANSCCTIS
eukprot:Lithocolla_globosa_v1_NODE_7172_length_983_cov_24.757543.p1 type:complete len:248 gc:universal NODE_7172_length_983_cov_24.757543:108-851(+)